jgi:leucyl/phenylalanyl-tRNA---protein transferase
LNRLSGVKRMKEREIIYLEGNIKFPDLRNRNDSGVIAFGGDLSVGRLLEAYRKGIFPWYNIDSPILWHSPLERCIFFINDFKVSLSLQQKLKKHLFTFTFDQHFKEIMQYCSLIKRKGEHGTWIFQETIDAYHALHKAGYAHSLEVWQNGQLAGGLYGVSLGKAFFGESMFHFVTDASKTGMHFLFEFLKVHEFHFVDAQMHTKHLMSLGATLTPRNNYLDLLDAALKHDTLNGNWNEYIREHGNAPHLYGRSYQNG